MEVDCRNEIAETWITRTKITTTWKKRHMTKGALESKSPVRTDL
jgi:hypothetical protein